MSTERRCVEMLMVVAKKTSVSIHTGCGHTIGRHFRINSSKSVKRTHRSRRRRAPAWDATEDHPEADAAGARKPMLEGTLDRLREAGFDEAFLVIGYKGEMIERHFARLSDGAHVLPQDRSTAPEVQLLGREFAGSDPFFSHSATST